MGREDKTHKIQNKMDKKEIMERIDEIIQFFLANIYDMFTIFPV